jgi:hypothetical protein
MRTENDIRTVNWKLLLPGDWTPDPDHAGGFHFESADGSKALYIATHIIAPGEARSAADLASWFVSAELSTLAAMRGYVWCTMERRVEQAPDAAIALLDCFAQAQDYRVIAKILARPGQLVRASFHDYQCRDYAASQASFAPILASLALLDLASQAHPILH